MAHSGRGSSGRTLPPRCGTVSMEGWGGGGEGWGGGEGGTASGCYVQLYVRPDIYRPGVETVVSYPDPHSQLRMDYITT